MCLQYAIVIIHLMDSMYSQNYAWNIQHFMTNFVILNFKFILWKF
jgi:hypothetical protein